MDLETEFTELLKDVAEDYFQTGSSEHKAGPTLVGFGTSDKSSSLTVKRFTTKFLTFHFPFPSRIDPTTKPYGVPSPQSTNWIALISLY